MKQLHYHKRTSDPALAPLFNTYFQRLRGLYEGGVRFYRKVFPMRYWTADMQIDGEHLHVALSPRDQAAFEFFTTGNPLYTGTVTQEGLSLTALKAACVSVQVSFDGDTAKWKPTIQLGARNLDGRVISPIQRPYQVQLIDEPVNYAPPTSVLGRNKYRKLVFETWAPGTSHSGVHLASHTQGQQVTNLHGDLGNQKNENGTLRGARSSTGTLLLRDVQYDVPWMSSTDGKPVIYSLLNSESLGSMPTTPVDWPRAGGVQTVKDVTYGTREFAIYIDSFNQISAYPTGHDIAPSGVNQTVSQTYVQTVSMGLPAWVWVPAQRLKTRWTTAGGDTGTLEFPEYDWHIHPDGTKCVAVVYAKVDVNQDNTFLPDSNSRNVANDFYTKFAGAEKRAQGNSHAPQRRAAAPGLIEVTIAIALTGPNPEDFTLTLTPTTLRDPTSHNMCTLFAGYLSQDIAGAGLRGDLCVWDVERYYRLPTTPDLPDSMFAGSSTTSYDDRLRTIAGVDHERDPNKTYASNWLTLIKNPYSQPANTDLGVTGAGMAPYGTDFRRTLYSLKNLTTSTELRTFPGCPSGVSAAYYIPPTDATNSITLFGTASYYYHNYALINSGVTRYDFHITTDAAWTPTLSSGDSVVYHLVLPWSFTCMTQGGMVNAPMHSRARFLKADMSTLSFVMQFEVGTVAWETQTIPADGNGVDTTGIDRKFYHHPAVAIWTFNEYRDTFFPSTMPDQYVAPSSYYTEPPEAQVAIKTRLNTLISEDFRTAHMAGNTWTLMGLGALPPGQSDDTWGSQSMAMLRYYVLGRDCMDNTNLRSAFQIAFDYEPVRNADASLAVWFYALGVFGSPVCLALTATPKFHWAMYSDLIMNSVAVNPLTCFFVHPNGTYAYFDVTHFYNRNGLMFGTRSAYTDSVTWWDATKVEHWIIDKVHLSFQLAARKVEKETSFFELYNTAVDALQPPPVTEPFVRLQATDLQATVTKLATGSVSIDGLSLQVAWGGHNYAFSEDSVRGITDVYYAIGNSGTLDWSLDYLFGGVVPQLAHPHLTFSSCCLVEDLLSG